MFRVFNSMIDKLQGARQDMFKIPDAARRVDAAWYVGMAINPVDFSQQLSRFQISLQGHKSSVGAEAAPK